MPRWWVRAAVETAQATRTVTPGTPGDAQLASYLVDCDAFVTADAAFAEIVDKVGRANPPARLGTALRITGGANVVSELSRAMPFQNV